MQKRIFNLSIIGLFLAGSLTLGACSSGSNDNQNETGKKQEEQHQHDKHAKEDQNQEGNQQAAYICPMECEGSASDEPGQCPECGMDLEKNWSWSLTFSIMNNKFTGIIFLLVGMTLFGSATPISKLVGEGFPVFKASSMHMILGLYPFYP